MSTTLIVLAVLAVAAGAYFLLIKKGKIEDKDGDFIADVVEDKVDSIKKEVKRRAKNVKAEIGDVKKASKELLDQASDVAEAAAGKTRKGRKPAAKKAPAKQKQQQVKLEKVENQLLKSNQLKERLKLEKMYLVDQVLEQVKL